MRTYERQTVRLGDNPVGFHLTKQVMHREVEGKMRKVKTLVNFPIWRGMDSRTFKQLRSDFKYQHKLHMWRLREAMEAENAVTET